MQGLTFQTLAKCFQIRYLILTNKELQQALYKQQLIILMEISRFLKQNSNQDLHFR